MYVRFLGYYRRLSRIDEEHYIGQPSQVLERVDTSVSSSSSFINFFFSVQTCDLLRLYITGRREGEEKVHVERQGWGTFIWEYRLKNTYFVASGLTLIQNYK